MLKKKDWMIKYKSSVRLRGKKIASTFSLFLALAYVYCLQNIYLCKCKWNSFDNPMSRVKRQNVRLNSFLTEDSARFILLMYFQSEYFWATYLTLFLSISRCSKVKKQISVAELCGLPWLE